MNRNIVLNIFKLIGVTIIIIIICNSQLLSVKNVIENNSFEGIVEGKYIDSSNIHHSKIIIYKDKNKSYEYDVDYPYLFDSTENGDYIIKRKGSMIFILIKKNFDTLIFKGN